MPVMTHPGIDLNGNTVRQAVCDGRKHAAAVVALARKYPSVAATTIMDLTVEAEAFGANIEFSDEAVPAVSGHMLSSVADIDSLQVPSLSAGRVPQYIKATLIAARELKHVPVPVSAPAGKRPLFGGCIGPFSLAGRLYDMSAMLMLIFEDAGAARRLLDKCTEFLLKYCKALKMAGADGVVMAEPAAGLMSDDDCRHFSSEFVKRIVDAVQDDSFMVILHNCGNTGHCTQAMVSTGAAAYHFGNKCSMAAVAADVPPTALAMGNIDPVSLFKEGTPQQMGDAVGKLLNDMKEFPNFVLSSGCDTPPHTPLENIDAFFSALEEWNRK